MYSSACALHENFVKLHRPNVIILYIFKEYIDKTLTLWSLQLTIFNDFFFNSAGGYVLISHNPKSFQHRAILACLN